MQVSPAGVALTKSMEGCSLTAYPDPASGGSPFTCGYGHTGSDVKPGMTITQAKADAWLDYDIARSAQIVNSLVHVYLNQNQFDALVDFVFNVGAGNFRSSTLLRLVNAGSFAAAADQFPRWTQAAGKVMPGLVKRREAERALFVS
ncbi:lysozyme [Paraburkholderia panacisoli]|uniref:Lysozyme n=2 Tax=Paraburkholderia panacisoli TaxID=2603818 RepID=A0A5B0HDC2_9BURK|nr:lysozyme [Paraburkholderia panacisoli]